jgi:hypothetical protein
MTGKAALCTALLRGQVVNIKNGFELFGITNIPREIGRSVEREFGVQVSRTQMEGKSRYGQPVVWVNYRLNRTEYNQEGIKKMIDYVASQTSNPKTMKEKKNLDTIKQLSFL